MPSFSPLSAFFSSMTVASLVVAVVVALAAAVLGRFSARALLARIPQVVSRELSLTRWALLATMVAILVPAALTLRKAEGVSAAAQTLSAGCAVGTIAWALYLLTGVLSRCLAAAGWQPPLVTALRRVLRAAVLGGALLALLQVFGVNVATLLASMGLGGIAVALAAKDTLGSLFASAMILADRPFAVGERIRVGEVEGEVEAIGWRSTQVRTAERALVVLPNSVLVGQTLDNLSRRSQRRFEVALGVTYGASAQRFGALMASLREAIGSLPDLDPESVRVVFGGFGESSFDVLVRGYTFSAEADDYWRVREAVALRSLEVLEAEGFALAYPTRTLVSAAPAGGGVQ